MRPDSSTSSIRRLSRNSPTEHYAIGDYAWSVSDRTLCSASPATQAPMWDCGPWGRAGEELLGAPPLDGNAGRRPNRGCGPRSAAAATWHNVTKQHRPRNYRDAGRERALGAADQSTRQAGASTSRRHWQWTRMESLASSGPEEKYYTGAAMRTSDGRSNRLFVYNRRSRMSIIRSLLSI